MPGSHSLNVPTMPAFLCAQPPSEALLWHREPALHHLELSSPTTLARPSEAPSATRTAGLEQLSLIPVCRDRAVGSKSVGEAINASPDSLTNCWLYAALPAPLASRVFWLPTLTLICLGLASAFLARLIFSIPLS